MADSDKQKDPRDGIHVNLDLGFGGLFKGLTDMVNNLTELSEKAEHLQQEAGADGERTFRFDGLNINGLGKDAEGVVGIRIRTLDGGQPVVERFGNIRPTDEGPEVADVREPLVDVFDEPTELLLVAELPGVSESDISLRVEDDILILETEGDRRYAKEVLLPAAVDATTLQHTYTNGILEVRLQKATPDA
ncbi:MAG: Hsp20/alpha crystallin family protein [Bacteroidota bacterium]